MEKLVDLFTHHAVLPEFWMWVIFGVAVLVLLLWDLNVRAVWAMGQLVEGTNKLF